MEILVLGGSGFLSRAVAETCRDEGHAVTVFTRGLRSLPEGVSAITGDRSDVDAFVRAFDGRPFDAVIDCICFRPEEAAADVRAFAGRMARLVMISTDFVYGPHRTLPMDESTPTQALNHYGQDKAACEELMLAAHRDEGFPVTILRPPHIMGAGGQLGTGSLQGRDPMLLDRLERGQPVVLLDGGQLLIQPVVHRDIARACLAAIASENAVGQAYNVAGPDCVTTRPTMRSSRLPWVWSRGSTPSPRIWSCRRIRRRRRLRSTGCTAWRSSPGTPAIDPRRPSATRSSRWWTGCNPKGR